MNVCKRLFEITLTVVTLSDFAIQALTCLQYPITSILASCTSQNDLSPETFSVNPNVSHRAPTSISYIICSFFSFPYLCVCFGGVAGGLESGQIMPGLAISISIYSCSGAAIVMTGAAFVTLVSCVQINSVHGALQSE